MTIQPMLKPSPGMTADQFKVAKALVEEVDQLIVDTRAMDDGATDNNKTPGWVEIYKKTGKLGDEFQGPRFHLEYNVKTGAPLNFSRGYFVEKGPGYKIEKDVHFEPDGFFPGTSWYEMRHQINFDKPSSGHDSFNGPGPIVSVYRNLKTGELSYREAPYTVRSDSGYNYGVIPSPTGYDGYLEQDIRNTPRETDKLPPSELPQTPEQRLGILMDAEEAALS